MTIPYSHGADRPEGDGGMPTFTEAEVLVNLLLDMNCQTRVCVETGEVLIKPEQGCPSAAISIAHQIRRKAEADPAFLEDLTSYVCTLGDNLLVPAPSVLSWVRVRSASEIIPLVAKAGLLIRHHYERDDVRTPMVSFMPIPGHDVGFNASILMMIFAERFSTEPEFARDVTAYVVAAGRSQHDA